MRDPLPQGLPFAFPRLFRRELRCRLLRPLPSVLGSARRLLCRRLAAESLCLGLCRLLLLVEERRGALRLRKLRAELLDGRAFPRVVGAVLLRLCQARKRCRQRLRLRECLLPHLPLLLQVRLLRLVLRHFALLPSEQLRQGRL